MTYIFVNQNHYHLINNLIFLNYMYHFHLLFHLLHLFDEIGNCNILVEGSLVCYRKMSYLNYI